MRIVSSIVPEEIIFSPKAWRSLRPLLLSPGFAVAECRRLMNSTSPAFLVDELMISPRCPRGEQFPPLADWLVWSVGQEAPDSAQELIEEIEPRASQSLVVGQFSIPQPELWDAVHWHSGQITPLSGFRVIGPGMLKVNREPEEVSTEESQDRESRTRGALGDEVYRKIRRSTVTLVGAGRNGSQMAWQLAALGVRHLRLIDPDVLEARNLNAAPGLLASDAGRSKVRALAERLIAFRPDLLVTALEASATETSAVDLMRQPADLLITCCDSDAPRLAAALVARDTLKVHLDVGTQIEREGDERRMFGDVRLLLPSEGCIRCVGGLVDREQTFYELAAPVGTLHRGVQLSWQTQRAGSLLQWNAIAIGCAVESWCQLLSGDVRGSLWQRLNWPPGAGLSVQSAIVSSADDCWLCQQQIHSLAH
jgi:hypothetical protein